MMSRRNLHRSASRFHKWLALLIGAQLLIWFSSGAFMSFVPIEQVRGEHLIDRNKADPLPAQRDVAKALSQLPGGTTSAEMVNVDRQPFIVARKGKQELARLDLQTGARLPTLNRRAVERIVHSAWIGKGHPRMNADLLREMPDDYHGDLPVWRVTMSDNHGTRAYVSPISGKILAVRTKTWRVYDFLWGLHIMDWKTRENFNSPWLFAFALGGLMLALAGIMLLVLRWPRRRRRTGGW